jgi:hypothetical protein
MANPYGAAGVPAPTSAADALGLGDALAGQRDQETDEQRKRRLAGLPEDQPGQSAAVRSLFDGLGTGLGVRGKGF